MEKIIDLTHSVCEICTQYPDILPLMQKLGFENITKPGMLQTAGRVMTIPKGSRMKGIPLETILDAFQKAGYTIKE
ncbi:DUF1858 domain-containing protein [Cytobacillus spongiae]|jgi:hypothetical protein|uniref:DUF1858 domain-containing protein n=1 Tax=Cytobacillus spongiae TaxID=2901381 RepID=UPI001F2866A4|nr:DUF1858 domain-containing protein [Cytobacillus spongiae]UII56363.1 DUF1858 domain-containing protein [Cytobacillus spongiae]